MAQHASEAIALPSGGGALSGIGEAFAPNLHKGTADLSVPLRAPAGRSGLTPPLSLTYSSGQGNGPFGLGWALPVPQIRRKTANGVPRYDASDVFMLGDDLIAVPLRADDPAATTRYRPRTESAYARILHVRTEGSDYWDVHSADGRRNRFGTPRPAGAATTWTDPTAVVTPDGHVFAWLLAETRDPLGNRIVYDYLADPHGTAARYLSRIRYVDHGDPATNTFLVGVEFNYADRPDPYSDRRGGFELRTTQRAIGSTTWTMAGTPTPTTSSRTTFTYADQGSDPPASGVSLLTRITMVGVDGAATEALPPLEFGYTEWQPANRRLLALTGELPPTALGGDLDLVDLFGDGLPSLVSINGTAQYWRNTGQGRFALPRPLAAAPAGVSLGAPGVLFADTDGDGRPELVASDAQRTLVWPLAPAAAPPSGRSDTTLAGFDPAGEVWIPGAAAMSLTDPLCRLVDLDGDGRMDLLRTADTWYAADGDGHGGFTDLRPLPGAPPVSLADPRVRLADMTGDGLSDVVYVHDGRIVYWPALGRGRFDPPATMTGAPHFTDPAYPGAGFDPSRLLLGDLTGDGTADMVYVNDGSVTIWLNRCGNGFAPPVTIAGTPPVTNRVTMRLADVLGTGVPGVLWSTDAGRPAPYRMLDPCGGVKPYLLSSIDNHCGATTAITYTTSTSYALADRDAGRPWRTTLPFPVHVVASTTTVDHFSATTLTSEFIYHHGYWDGADREFRGFARVDQRDNRIGATASPPVEVRTWFHPGPVGPTESNWQALDLSDEYWPTSASLWGAVDDGLLPAMPRSALRTVLRSMTGRMLRTETYALDGSPDAARPYEVGDAAYRLVPVLDGRPGTDPGWLAAPVAAAHQVATQSVVWQRGDDPMIRVTAFGARDTYGRACSQLEIGVPRGRDPRAVSGGPGSATVEPYLGQVTVTEYATRDDLQAFRTDRMCLSRREEITDPGGVALTQLVATTLAAADAGQTVGEVRALELTFYDGAAHIGLPFGELGAWGLASRVERLVLTPQVLAAACTPGDGSGLAAGPPVYLPLDGVPPAITGWPVEYPPAFVATVPPLAGYTFHDAGEPYVAGYYAEDSRCAYDVQTGAGRYGLPVAQRDALGADTTVGYDPYGLLPVSVTDPVGLTQSVDNDYRVLRPRQVTDANGVRRRAGYTPTGLPAWIAVLAPDGVAEGDTIDQPGLVFAYSLTAWDDSAAQDTRQPMSVRSTARVDHRWTLVHQDNAARAAAGQAPLSDADIAALFPPDELARFPRRFLVHVDYTDGHGRLLQSRRQGDEVSVADLGLDADMTSPARPASASRGPDRAVVSGARQYDDKGRVIREWEPYFGTGLAWVAPDDTTLAGLAHTTTSYDARGLAVRAAFVDGSVQLIVPGVPGDLTDPSTYRPTPWETYHYDADDNAGRTHRATTASWSAQWNTPLSATVDALGRQIASTAHLPDGATATTTTAYDIDGRIAAVTDALGRTAARYVLDAAGRAWRTQTIDTGVVRTVFDALGQPVEMRDDRGAMRLSAGDAAHRPTHHWATERSDTPATLRGLTVYADDPAQSGLSADQAAAVYALGRPVRTYDEAGLVRADAYNIDGHPVRTARRVLRTDLLLAALPPGAAEWSGTSYVVDWQPPAGTTPADRESALLDTVEYATDSGFDALGRCVSLTAPVQADGARTTIAYAYQRGGQLGSISAGGTTYLEQVLYNPRGQRTLTLTGNGVLVRHVYDPATTRLVRLRAEPANPAGADQWAGAATSSAVIQDYGYGYDLVGNLLRVADRTPGSGMPVGPGASGGPDALDRTFGYDALYRLISATGRQTAAAAAQPWIDIPAPTDVTLAQPYTETYSYDIVGNLLTLAHQANRGYTRTYAPEPATNRLATLRIGQTPIPYAYDAAGNLVNEADVRRYEWDPAGRCATFRVQTGTATPSIYAQYRYDPTGQRVVKLVQRGLRTDVTIYINGVFERLIRGAQDATTATVHDQLHLMVGTERAAILRRGGPLPDDPFPVDVYHLGDHIASSVAVLDGNGAVLNREEYTPFGETTFGGYATKRYRFTAKERDEESGLAYHGQRYYTPWLARWTAPDPQFPTGSLTWYRYARNSPLTVTDPSGATDVPEAIEKEFRREVDLSHKLIETNHGDADKVGQAIMDQSDRIIQGTGMKGLRKSATTLFAAFDATVASTAVSVLGDLVLSGPQFVCSIDSIGKNLKGGLLQVKHAKTRADMAHGIVQYQQGVNELSVLAISLFLLPVAAEAEVATSAAATNAARAGSAKAIAVVDEAASVESQQAVAPPRARFIMNTARDMLDTSKITIPRGKLSYLLENTSKAGVFRDSMGFDKQSLDAALRNHLLDNFDSASPAVPMYDGAGVQIGVKFRVTSPLTGPSGATWKITSAWGVDWNRTIRLITATP
jgi:RHS repeat-associated protein